MHGNTRNLTDFQKDQLLDFFAYYLPMDMRERLMATLPRAYNAWCGSKVVKVVHTSSQAEAVTPLDLCEAQKEQVQ